MDFEYKEEYKYLTDVCLNLTDACNLACRYCFVEQHPHYITLETAKKAADFLHNNLEIKKEKFNLKSNAQATITYFGGEPTLLWNEIIVPLTNYCNEKYPNDFNFTITTNGTLLNDERIKFLKDNNIYPLLSIDGAKTTQDYNRPCHNSNQSSFELVSNNIQELLRQFPDVTFRSTIDQNTVQYLYENYLFAEFCGFNSWYAMPNCRDKWKPENVEKLKEQFVKIYTYRLIQFRNNIMPMSAQIIDNSFTRLAEMDIAKLTRPKEIPNTHRTVLRCGLGTTTGSIGYNGLIYGCQEQPSRDDKNIFVIGDIYKGINKEKHSKLLKEYSKRQISYCENKEKCINCELRPICVSFMCPSTSWDLYGNFVTNSEIGCEWLNMMTNIAANTTHILVKENNLLFKKYLEKYCGYNKYLKKEG